MRPELPTALEADATIHLIAYCPFESQFRSPVADVVIQVETTEAFALRPLYSSALVIAPDEFGQIFGKYELPEAESSWATCGLNGCTKRHRFGYLIRKTNGQETNCGQDCGLRKFGVKFTEVVAQMERQFSEQARQRVLVDLIEQRATLVRRAELLLPRVKSAAEAMRKFFADFQSKDRFWAQLQGVARLNGEIRTAQDETQRGGSGRAAVSMVTIGRLEGASVLLSSNVQGHERGIAFRVLPWLRDVLGAPGIELLNQDALEKLLGDAGPMRDVLTGAEDFIAESARFLQPRNLAQLELIRTHLMPSHGEQKALKRAVKRWVEGIREP